MRVVQLLAGYADGDAISEEARLIQRGLRAGREAAPALAENDSHGFFAAEGGLVVTGPTGTNVMDLLLFRVDPTAL